MPLHFLRSSVITKKQFRFLISFYLLTYLTSLLTLTKRFLRAEHTFNPADLRTRQTVSSEI